MEYSKEDLIEAKSKILGYAQFGDGAVFVTKHLNKFINYDTI